jgi:hypothetical protein
MFSYDISNPALPIPQGYFGIDRAHDDAPLNASITGARGLGRDVWCTAHIYNFIPGTSIMVASWYSGGINIIDWTEPTSPREIAHYRTDGDDYSNGEITNYWSAYWHDGRIYANDRVRGFDALKWTAYEEYVSTGGGTDAAAVTRFARSQPSTAEAGWRSGRFYETPTAAQAMHLASRPKADLATGLSPYACRLTLLD